MPIYRCANCDILIEPYLAASPCPRCNLLERRVIDDGEENGDDEDLYFRAVLAEGPGDRAIFLGREATKDQLLDGIQALARREGGVLFVGVTPDGRRDGPDPDELEDWFKGFPTRDELGHAVIRSFGGGSVGEATLAWVLVDPRSEAASSERWGLNEDLDVRRAIRMSRARPPNLASSSSERRATYRAALAQFEELLSAAEQATPASRPLLLYYCLTQAGTALLAARGTEMSPDPAHGLGWDRSGAFLTRHIRPRSKGVFPAVCNAIKASPLKRPVTIAEVWTSLPEFSKLPIPTTSPRAIRVWRWTEGRFPGWSKIPDFRVGGVLEVSAVGSYDELKDLLAHYPQASEWKPGSIGDGVQYGPTPQGLGIVVYWRAAGTSAQDLDRRFSAIAPPYRELGNWLLPEVGGSGEPVVPFLAWWMLLYALSMLTRYEPGTWTTSLDVDRTEIATALEVTVDEALTAIPDIVFDVLAH